MTSNFLPRFLFICHIRVKQKKVKLSTFFWRKAAPRFLFLQFKLFFKLLLPTRTSHFFNIKAFVLTDVVRNVKKLKEQNEQLNTKIFLFLDIFNVA